jgi:hypothetical protein
VPFRTRLIGPLFEEAGRTPLDIASPHIIVRLSRL